MRLKFRQWRVLHCLKKHIVVIGGRRTGKSYTSQRFAIKHLLNGSDVIFLSSDSNLVRARFSNIGTILRNDRRLKYLSIYFNLLFIKRGKNFIRFSTENRNFEDIVKCYYKNNFCVLVADEIWDIPQLISQIFYLERKYQMCFKKVLITGTPVDVRCNKEHIKSLDNTVKVFKWKGKYYG